MQEFVKPSQGSYGDGNVPAWSEGRSKFRRPEGADSAPTEHRTERPGTAVRALSRTLDVLAKPIQGPVTLITGRVGQFRREMRLTRDANEYGGTLIGRGWTPDQVATRVSRGRYAQPTKKG